jgi:hypothetical protein
MYDRDISYTGKGYLEILLLFLLFPTAAIASDYTGLFFLFLEVPILGVTLLFLTIGLFAPKTGLILLTFLLPGILFALAWASEVGYMSEAGGLILLSLIIDIGGIFLAIIKIQKAREAESNEST